MVFVIGVAWPSTAATPVRWVLGAANPSRSVVEALSVPAGMLRGERSHEQA
jgi:hypothetical protein